MTPKGGSAETVNRSSSWEPPCCTLRAHVRLFLELAEVAQHDPNFHRQLAYARRLLFAGRANR